MIVEPGLRPSAEATWEAGCFFGQRISLQPSYGAHYNHIEIARREVRLRGRRSTHPLGSPPALQALVGGNVQPRRPANPIRLASASMRARTRVSKSKVIAAYPRRRPAALARGVLARHSRLTSAQRCQAAQRAPPQPLSESGLSLESVWLCEQNFRGPRQRPPYHLKRGKETTGRRLAQ